jgi:hypothetical protein
MSKRDVSAGFRRILYDAMVLSASLRAIRECNYYRRWKASDVDGCVEAHQANALIQIRSMIDFLTCHGRLEHDTMTVVQFFGCTKQALAFPERKASNKYAAHKSWDAVAKDANEGARQLRKPQIVELGIRVLEGFHKFWEECDRNVVLSMNAYAKRYSNVLNENMIELRRRGS